MSENKVQWAITFTSGDTVRFDGYANLNAGCIYIQEETFGVITHMFAAGTWKSAKQVLVPK